MGTVGGAVVGAATGIGPAAGAVIGGISGGFLGHHLEKNKSLAQKIAGNGVQIVLVGDHLRLILPSDRFFAPNTPILNENYYPVLDQIALLLKGLNKYVVKVTGYTDNTGWPEGSLGLSRQQAQVIANYLWNRGIDARVVYATGYGSQFPIASNATAEGRAMNRRVEITIREITDDRAQ
jgi:outer membrane protein OmpA-like peptidoglycan-associated protein